MNSFPKETNPGDFDPMEAPAATRKRKDLRLGMMHYHLRPGGVTSVMRDMAIALGSHSEYESIRIDVLASVGSEERAHKTFAAARGERVERLKIVDVPALAYRGKPYQDKEAFLRAAEGLAKEMLKHADAGGSAPECPYVLHSHNISLGKNPVATMALKLAAEEARERSLPVWFINQAHDLAENNRPEQMRAFFNCTGKRNEAFARSFMYPNTPNVLYLTINSADIGSLIELGIARDRIFLLPDPIDWRPYGEGALWEKDAAELAAMGLEAVDHKELMLQRLSRYAASKGHIFDPSRPILLSPLKVMRRKNNVESLLLLALFKHLGTDCQLLISLGANSPPDNAYSRRLLNYAASRGMAVVTGFGHEIISETDRRSIRNRLVTRYTMGDLYGLCSAALTTSVVEGFGLAYHEGWLCGKPVIGRKIPEITADFEANGMNFDHTYEKLAVPLDGLPDLRQRLRREYETKLHAMPRGGKYAGALHRLSTDDIINAKLFRLGGRRCVDFADLSLELQLEMLDALIEDPSAITRLIDLNPAVALSYEAIANSTSDRLQRLVDTNRSVVQSKYSLDAMARRLENIVEHGDSLYREDCVQIPLTVEKHALTMQKYVQPEMLRLIF
jgi:glycosyltransferase involved in cell wall biosynthesis